MLIKNYFRTATRHLKKNRFFTVLNVFCLALGMSISLLFVALISFLVDFDDFHPAKDRTYRVNTHVKDNDENPQYASAPQALAQKLSEDFTGIETVVQMQTVLNWEAIYQEKKVGIYSFFTQPEFLKVFNFPLVKGNSATALTEPFSIIVTEKQAKNFFGDKEPMGETITIEPYGDFVVTGVLKDLPKNSHHGFDALVSHSTLATLHEKDGFVSEETWTKFMNSYIYVVLSENYDPADVQRGLNKISADKYKTPENYMASFKLQALEDIVPGPSFYNANGKQWDYLGLTLIGLTTMIILIPACANYVHLSISQSLNRMKEIGVRKVMGGQRKQIFFQFVMEAMITMMLALVLSYFMFEAIRHKFLEIIGSETTDLTPTLLTVVLFILFALLVGGIAGISPALYFSKINPVKALKGKPEQTRHGFKFPVRKIMITAQFILSLGFITAVVIMFQQYRFSVNYDQGFEKENILDVELKNIDHKIFKTEYAQLSSVEQISMSSHILGLEFNAGNLIRNMDQSDSIESVAIAIDENFIANLGLELVAGKGFTDNASENAQFIIINEHLMSKLKLNDAHEAIGKSVIMPDGRGLRVGGVVKDFHYASLKEPIGNLYFEYDPKQFVYANLKVTSKEHVDLAKMDALWKKIGGTDRFTAKYFADEIADAYSFYFEVITIWGYLGLLAITVACLGLLGTVVFTIKNRLKEVSIRKVVGASSESLVYLLSKDFILLMVIASIITLPTVYFAFQDWLIPSVQHYAAQIGILELGTSLVIMSSLGLTTIFSQTMKAANANPVDNLRSE
jgi:putative ABC transport system permease protein